ncbi:MAG: hypothetical protein HY903_01455 [Deltaproteobacteria bacterium]|nr:hypothetical protein [Deltaproteobacteria bacterium]
MVVSLPLALVLERLIAAAPLPSFYEDVRRALGPILTLLAWWGVAVAVPVDVFAVLLHRSLWAKAAVTERDPAALRWKRFETLMITASVAQVPGLVAVVLSTLGAGLLPVVVCVAISSLGAAALAFCLRR